MRATTSIPIVVGAVADLVALGGVQSLPARSLVPTAHSSGARLLRRGVAMTKADLDEFRSVLHRCWSLETSSQWLPDNPARGQCNVTALVVCDRFGGEILKTPVGDEWHFYNRVAGTVYDLTAEQFSVLPAYLDIPSTRDEALAGTAPERYQTLAVRVSQALVSK